MRARPAFAAPLLFVSVACAGSTGAGSPPADPGRLAFQEALDGIEITYLHDPASEELLGEERETDDEDASTARDRGEGGEDEAY